MKRRNFLKNTVLSVAAVSTAGFVRFENGFYVGDCETTTDILGPFYRPDSPVRSNLVIKNAPGKLVILRGHIKHKDCATASSGAKIELWHCGADGVYDNSTGEFRYRGTTFADKKGYYTFQTILPVPYHAGGNLIRPAHFHLLISAPGYQSLVTQLYFAGDKHIDKDPWASSPNAKRRILEIKNGTKGEKIVSFDITMMETIPADPASLEQLTGIYKNEKDNSGTIEFLKKDNALWMKNELFGYNLTYIGNNTFQPSGTNATLHFEVLSSGEVRLSRKTENERGESITAVYIKDK